MPTDQQRADRITEEKHIVEAALRQPQLPPLLDQLCADLKVRPDEFKSSLGAVFKDIHPSPTPGEQQLFYAFCKEYQLDPRLKHVHVMRRYLGPNKAGPLEFSIMIDGWLFIANRHPQFDGIQLKEVERDRFSPLCHPWVKQYHEKDIGCEAALWRKDRSHPITKTEWLSENFVGVKEGKKPNQWMIRESRMIGWRGAIQVIRIGFNVAAVSADEIMDERSAGEFVDDTQKSANDAVAAAVAAGKGGDASAGGLEGLHMTSGEGAIPPTSSPDTPQPPPTPDQMPADQMPAVEDLKPEDPKGSLPF